MLRTTISRCPTIRSTATPFDRAGSNHENVKGPPRAASRSKTRLSRTMGSTPSRNGVISRSSTSRSDAGSTSRLPERRMRHRKGPIADRGDQGIRDR